jgi:hypothetical protein
VAPLRKSRAAENIGAGFLTFAEMLKEWENSSVDNPKSPYRKFWAMVITD